MTWFLWEIAKHPDSQDHIRAEIAALRARKGVDQFSSTDLDSLTFTMAAMKVPYLGIITHDAVVSDNRPLLRRR